MAGKTPKNHALAIKMGSRKRYPRVPANDLLHKRAIKMAGMTPRTAYTNLRGRFDGEISDAFKAIKVDMPD